MPCWACCPATPRWAWPALLPHQTLAYKEKRQPGCAGRRHLVATLEQRGEHLKPVGGMAVKAEDLMALGKDKGRELVRDQRLIYVYHDRIDMTGDKQASETKTFEAAAQTVQELSQLLGFIINSLNGSTVLVTADHGFIYQESPLDEADKSTLDDKGRHAEGQEALPPGPQPGRHAQGLGGQHGRDSRHHP
jgi:hypothetical protein